MQKESFSQETVKEMREICTTAFKNYVTSMTFEVSQNECLKMGKRLTFVCFFYNKQHSFKSYVAIHSIPQQVKWFNVQSILIVPSCFRYSYWFFCLDSNFIAGPRTMATVFEQSVLGYCFYHILTIFIEIYTAKRNAVEMIH